MFLTKTPFSFALQRLIDLWDFFFEEDKSWCRSLLFLVIIFQLNRCTQTRSAFLRRRGNHLIRGRSVQKAEQLYFLRRFCRLRVNPTPRKHQQLLPVPRGRRALRLRCPPRPAGGAARPQLGARPSHPGPDPDPVQAPIPIPSRPRSRSHTDPSSEAEAAEPPRAGGHSAAPGLCHPGFLSRSVPPLFRLRTPFLPQDEAAAEGPGCALAGVWGEPPAGPCTGPLALLPHQVLTVVLEDIPRKTRVTCVPR